jgi:hypothetical protein
VACGTPWDKSPYSAGKTDPNPGKKEKKKLNNKQAAERKEDM